MGFYIGEKVIHCTHGMGEIVNIEEKNIHDSLTNCYVVRTADLTIWIPIDDLQVHSLRVPVSSEEFLKLSAILSKPSEVLSEDRMLRKDRLVAQMNEGQLASIFQIVRDLTQFKRSTRLTSQEKFILETAINSLLTEWTYSLGIPLNQAHLTMTNLLGG